MVRKLTSLLLGLPAWLLSPAALAQGEAPPAPADFRPYVFLAYTTAFVLLFVFLGILLLRQKSLARDVDALKERVQKQE